MSKGNSNHSDLSFYRSKSRVSLKNNLKRTSAKQLIEETRVCDYVSLYTEDVNHILTRAGAGIVLGLEFEEGNKRNDISLRQLDPVAADFVRSVIEKVKIANRMLKSFRLRLVIQEASA
jgi:hypothetical protein